MQVIVIVIRSLCQAMIDPHDNKNCELAVCFSNCITMLISSVVEV